MSTSTLFTTSSLRQSNIHRKWRNITIYAFYLQNVRLFPDNLLFWVLWAVLSLSLGLMCGTIGYMGTRYRIINFWGFNMQFSASSWGKYMELSRLIRSINFLYLVICSCIAQYQYWVKFCQTFRRFRKPKRFIKQIFLLNLTEFYH